MRLLCIAAKSSPTGFVAVAGRPCSSTDIARLSGVSEQEVELLLGELSRNGVFSRDAQGRIYSRRMVRDNKKRFKLRQNGAKGGQTSFLNGKGIFALSEQNDKQQTEQSSEPQKPESRVHKPESIPPVGPPAANAHAEVKPLAVDWILPNDWREIALSRGWIDAAISQQAVRFKQYFSFGKGSGIKRSNKGWRQSWLNWLDREIKTNPDAANFGRTDAEDTPPIIEASLSEDVQARLKIPYAPNDIFIRRWLAPCAFDFNAGIIIAPTRFHADFLASQYADAVRRAFGREMKIVAKDKGATHG
ncbi:MAG: hypothetical protein PHS57_00860 [Alphaproteobacteria bacterium]|nr:hypothetical protein [Alphaproteobacteria bacterium]